MYPITSIRMKAILLIGEYFFPETIYYDNEISSGILQSCREEVDIA